MKSDVRKVKMIKYSILIFSIATLITVSLMSMFSCTAGVDVGEATKLLTSFSLKWPEGFDYTSPSGMTIDVTIHALDQNGKVFEWNGSIDVKLTNAGDISVNPETVTITNGSVQTGIEFNNSSSEDQVTDIILKYGDIVTELKVELLVLIEGSEIPKKVSASDGIYMDKVVIRWNDVVGAESYDVYRAESEVGDYTYLDNTTNTMYADTTAARGTTYYYKINAYLSIYGYTDFSDHDSGYKWNYFFKS